MLPRQGVCNGATAASLNAGHALPAPPPAAAGTPVRVSATASDAQVRCRLPEGRLLQTKCGSAHVIGTMCRLSGLIGAAAAARYWLCLCRRACVDRLPSTCAKGGV